MEEIRRRRVRRENNENIPKEEPIPTPEKVAEAIGRTVVLLDEHGVLKQFYTPERILKSNNATVVFWKDGSKTVVKCNPETVPDDYGAFTAALAIRIYGNNSQLKKLLKQKTVVQEIKPKKMTNTPPETEAAECGKDYCEI